MSPASQIRSAMTDPAKWGDPLTWERWSVGWHWFGSAALWAFAHAFAPSYRREKHQFPGVGMEVVQSPTEYRRNGGDCDDDVLMTIQFASSLGIPATAAFLGDPPRHVQTATPFGFIDRVPGAKRWGFA